MKTNSETNLRKSITRKYIQHKEILFYKSIQDKNLAQTRNITKQLKEICEQIKISKEQQTKTQNLENIILLVQTNTNIKDKYFVNELFSQQIFKEYSKAICNELNNHKYTKKLFNYLIKNF